MKKLIAAIFLALFAFACGGDDGNGPGTDNGPAADTTAPVDTQVGTDTTTPAPTFSGTLVDFASKIGKEGVDLQVLDNDTGEVMAGQPQLKSGVGGAVSLTIAKDTKFAMKAWGKDSTGKFEFKDTYQFNVPWDAQNKRLYAVSKLTYMTAPPPAGITVDPTKGIIAGSVYWKDPATGEEHMVGCGTVTVKWAGDAASTPATSGEVRYFNVDTDLPAPLTKATMTTVETSRYLVGNLPLGMREVSLKIDGKDVELEFPVKLRSYQDSICISNLYVKSATNPSPDRPECDGIKSGVVG